MAALTDVEHVVVRKDGTDVVVLARGRGKRQEAVEAGHLIGIDLDGGDKLAQSLHQLVVELCLEHQYLVFRAEYLLFVFLQFLRDVAFGVDQRLLAYPLLGYFLLVDVAHLDVVAEDVVVTYLQARYARQLAFALLQLEQVVLAAVGYLAQLIELGADALLDDAALVDQQRRVVVDFTVDAVADGLADVELLADTVQAGIVGLQAGLLDGFDGLQRHLQRHHLAGADTSHGHLRQDALQVADAVQLLLHQVAEVGLAEEVFHHVQAVVDGAHVLQREHQPAFHQAGTHGADGPVDDAEQRTAPVVHRAHQLEAAHSKLIEPDVFVFLDAGQRRDVAYLRVLRHDEVLQDGSRSDDAVLQVLHAEAFQILHLEMLQQLFACRRLSKHPVVQLEGEELAAEVALEHRPLASFEEHLLGAEVVEQLVDVVEGAFCRQELTRRYVQKSHAAGSLAEVYGSQEVVLAVVQHVVVDADTGRHQLRNAALHQLLGQLGVFQLVADGHALARTDELGQVRVERMIGKSGHLDGLLLAVGTLGQRDAQDFGGHNGIGRVGFIEVSATEQHHGVRVLGLEVEKLFHHRCKDNIFVHEVSA